MDINLEDSVRFFPNWNPMTGDQVSGLIRMVFDIYLMDPSASDWVEIGTLSGESALIISAFPFVKKFRCVDKGFYRRRKMLDCRLSRRITEGVVEVFEMTSAEYEATLPEGERVDVVYIDGDHSRDGAKLDIMAWWPRVRPGGFLCGHDFHPNHPGVVESVSEFLMAEGLEMRTYEDFSWLVRRPIAAG